MHEHFPNWYNAVSLRRDAETLQLDAKTLQLRWDAVEELAQQLKVADAPGLVRVFFCLAGADQFLDQIRKVAREKDQTFVTDGDRNELTVLAGAAIAQIVAEPSAQADAVALSVSCVGAQGLRQAPRLQGVVDETARYLAEESVRIRTIGKGAVADVNTAALTKLIASRGGVAVSDVNSVWNGVDVVLKEFLSEHTKHTHSVNQVLDKAMARQREESDILWWLFSEHTLDGTKAFTKLSIPEACFWGARDLASLTHFLPGPFASPAFLHRMLKLVEDPIPSSVKLSEAVDACDLAWRQKWVATLSIQQLAEFCPMLFAISKSVEVGGGTTWTAAFEHATGLKVKGKLAPVHLAMQIYNEGLLLRALAVRG